MPGLAVIIIIPQRGGSSKVPKSIQKTARLSHYHWSNFAHVMTGLVKRRAVLQGFFQPAPPTAAESLCKPTRRLETHRAAEDQRVTPKPSTPWHGRVTGKPRTGAFLAAHLASARDLRDLRDPRDPATAGSPSNTSRGRCIACKRTYSGAGRRHRAHWGQSGRPRMTNRALPPWPKRRRGAGSA